MCPVFKEQTTDVMNITVNVLKIKDKKNHNYILFSKGDAYSADKNYSSKTKRQNLTFGSFVIWFNFR